MINAYGYESKHVLGKSQHLFCWLFYVLNKLPAGFIPVRWAAFSIQGGEGWRS